jgi:hypothetical protein
MNQELFEEHQPDPKCSQWYTPQPLADRIAKWATEIANDLHNVLESSAGAGNLVAGLVKALDGQLTVVTAIERDERQFPGLQDRFAGTPQVHTHCFDSLGEWPAAVVQSFELAVINPPYENGQTEAHILAALARAKRVVCHCPLTTLAGVGRYDSLWSKVVLNRMVVHSSRQKYGVKGGSTDMCTLEIVRSLGKFHDSIPSVEWWRS